MRRITSASSRPLYSVAATRDAERQAAAALPPHTLMQRAGLAVARLTLALAPHARCIWVACGPGNNGGDGFEAALQLHQWGKAVVLTWSGLPHGTSALPPDAQAARERALAAGVPMAEQPPPDFDFCIDALLGMGARRETGRPGDALIVQWLALMQTSRKPGLSVDIPSGLDADTGQYIFSDAIKSIADGARSTDTTGLFDQNCRTWHSLSLLTLKPGLFTADGRDWAGEVWFDDLAAAPATVCHAKPVAWLLGQDRAAPLSRAAAAQGSHKGSFGDVAILGGESTPASQMTGAALLAARAALHAGAGRVLVALLPTSDPQGQQLPAPLSVDPIQPELMFRSPQALDLKRQVVVCGCGGGEAIKSVLARVLSSATRLVLDADALNAIAADSPLQSLLTARQGRGYSTVLTPHPLEAARLAGLSTGAVQADRLRTAEQLAARYAAVVVLKGSGTVIASPGRTSCINASGNALLATAGTGDVLAGMLGANLASGLEAFDAACAAVFAHGRLADVWRVERPGQALVASSLANAPWRV